MQSKHWWILLIIFGLLTTGFNVCVNADPPSADWEVHKLGRNYIIYHKPYTSSYRMENYDTSIHYEENDMWLPIDTQFRILQDTHPLYDFGYRSGCDSNQIKVFFKQNIQEEFPIACMYHHGDDYHFIRQAPQGFGYYDRSTDDFLLLDTVRSSEGEIVADNVGLYPDLFYYTDLYLVNTPYGLKENLVMKPQVKTYLQDHPPSSYGMDNQQSYLVSYTELEYVGLTFDGEFDVTFDFPMKFYDELGRLLFTMPVGEVYEYNNPLVCFDTIYRLEMHDGKPYLLMGIPVTDINSMSFPIVFDPSVSAYSDEDDGFIIKIDADYTTCHDAATGTVLDGFGNTQVGQFYTGGSYYIYRTFLMFDTTAIPDSATVDSASLRLRTSAGYEGSANFSIQIQEGMPTYPHMPMVVGDYYYDNYGGSGCYFNTSLFYSGSSVTETIDLNATGVSWIKKDTYTKLCLRSSWDVNEQEIQYDDTVISFSSGDDGTDAFKPMLTVEYTLNVETEVDDFDNYNQYGSPITVTATSEDSGLDAVNLFFRYSSDNVSWETQYENYTVGDDAEVTILSVILVVNRQTFELNSSYLYDNFLVSNFSVYGRKVNTVNNIRVSIVNNETGALIGYTDTQSTLPTSNAWITMKCSDIILLEKDVEYYFTVTATMSGRSSFKWRYDNTSVAEYPRGYRYTYAAPNTYSYYYEDDFLFRINGSWMNYTGGVNPDVVFPWSWDFVLPFGVGYYCFIGRGEREGEVETLDLDVADACCYCDLFGSFLEVNRWSLFLSLGFCFVVPFWLVWRRRKKKEIKLIHHIKEE